MPCRGDAAVQSVGDPGLDVRLSLQRHVRGRYARG